MDSVVFLGGREASTIKEISENWLGKATISMQTCSTHRQLSDEQLTEAGITPGMVRLSVGLENIDDLLEDLSQALAQA